MVVCFRVVLCCVLATLACGCGGGEPGPPRRVVTGKATFDGQPIAEGEVRFVPVEGSDNPASGAAIRAGSYTANGLGGVPIGSYRVEIRAYQADPQADDGGKLQVIPDKYNKKSTLSLSVTEGKEPMSHDIELSK